MDGAGDVFIADVYNGQVLEVQLVAGNFGNVNVCPAGQSAPAPCNQTLTLNYNIGATTTFGTPGIVTQGAPNLDFTLSSGGTCTGTVGAGSTCTLNVTFAPLAPGVRMGAVELFDNSGKLLVTTQVRGIGQGPAIAFGPGVQTTVGSGLSNPDGVAVDAAGDLFIADSFNSRVVEVPAGCSSVACQTTLGSGLNHPAGVTLDAAGNVVISDSGNNRVVEVPPGCSSAACQTTVGSGLNVPFGVAVDGAGDIFIADHTNNRVVEVNRSQPPSLSFASTPVGQTSSDSSQSVTAQNIGNQPLDAVNPGVFLPGPNFAQVPGSGTPADCTNGFALMPGASCNLSVSFEPKSPGTLASAAVFLDNALNASPSASQSIAARHGLIEYRQRHGRHQSARAGVHRGWHELHQRPDLHLEHRRYAYHRDHVAAIPVYGNAGDVCGLVGCRILESFGDSGGGDDQLHGQLQPKLPADDSGKSN